ncbi:MAG TPA: ASKHA domain-containing protein [Phycisphaerae bacterium]|nr:ASKHA domain-containing protein [Phycisphaerae bacterium]
MDKATEQVSVVFHPPGRSVSVLRGTTLLEAAALAGLTIDTPCGGGGTCGKCRVHLAGKAPAACVAEEQMFGEGELAAGWRLACQVRVQQPCTVEVPESSLFAGQCQIQERSETGEVAALQPSVRKVYVEMEAPTLESDAPDLLRLEQRVGAFEADLDILTELPGRLREKGFRGTAVLADHRLIDFETGDTSGRCFGAAFDIGTTTLVGSLMDLGTGAELAVASSVNPQVGLGDDVLSRIRHVDKPDGLKELQQAVVSEVNRLIGRLCAEAGVEPREVYEIALAGNTTMEHFVCGIDPTPLGQMPFVPAFGRGLLLRAADLGLTVHPGAFAYVFPVIGSFVGGDTVGGILTTRLASLDGPALMVDVGTNGEIVLAHDGQLWAASTAAGPAFEGARISCGMRASRGAIEKVVLDEDVRLGTIGESRPTGLCGSGLIDLAAELIRVGIVSLAGRLLPPDKLPRDLPAAIRQRVRLDPAGKVEFVLADARTSGTGEDLAITQRDIRELQLAAGAIRAGIRILLRQAGFTPADLKVVLLAGGFGSFIRRRNARQIGLLPPELESHHIHYVGNTSLSGARWALLSVDARRRAEELARHARHIELSMDTQFQMEFGEAMIFPAPP